MAAGAVTVSSLESVPLRAARGTERAEAATKGDDNNCVGEHGDDRVGDV